MCDAILLRFGDLDSKDHLKIYTVLIDGGYAADWEKVQKILSKNFQVNYIDLVISTHPDQDHINGLVGVLENIKVLKLWMHQPWEHSADYLEARQEDFNKADMTKWLQKSLQGSNDLAMAADVAKVEVEEPFAGKQFSRTYGTLTVLSPTQDYYEELLPQILDKSAAKVVKSAGAVSNYESLMRALTGGANKGIERLKTIYESHTRETLTDGGSTTPARAIAPNYPVIPPSNFSK